MRYVPLHGPYKKTDLNINQCKNIFYNNIAQFSALQLQSNRQINCALHVVDDFQITVDICPLNIAMAGLIQDRYIYEEEEEKYII